MERPGSRGAMALASAGIARPPTADQQHAPWAAERPPSASTTGPGSGVGRPGSAFSSGTAPPGTAYRRTGVLGAAATALFPGSLPPAPAARPLTQQHGLGGGGAPPGTAGGGNGRQVLDRGYFIAQLRQKRQEIATATQQLQDEAETLQQRGAAAARTERRVIELKGEVRALQEALADANIILDKAGSHVPLDAIAAELDAARARNTGQRARAERMAAERMALEARARQAEARIADIEAAAQARLGAMPPGQRAAYQALQQEHEALLAEAAARDAALDDLDAAVAAAEGELGRSPTKQRALELQDAVRQLQQRRADLAADEEQAKAPPEVQRDVLMAKVKRDTAEVESLAAAAKAAQEEVRALEARQEASIARAAGSGGQASVQESAADKQARREKYDELCAKERELSAFADTFPSQREAKRREIRQRQDAVVAALERVGKLRAAAGREVPATGAAQQQQPLTGPALAAELTARRAELEKVEHLADKVSEELGAMDARLSEAEAAAARMADTQGARQAAEARCQELEVRRRELAGVRDTLKAALAHAVALRAEREAQLTALPAWPLVSRSEQRMAGLHKQLEEARGAVAARHAEAQACGDIAAEVGALVGQLNAWHLRTVALESM